MRIVRDEKIGTLTFVPADSKEEAAVRAITDNAKAGDMLQYKGRESDEGSQDFFVVHLNFGGHLERREQRPGIFTYDIEGGQKFTLRGTTEDDKYAVNGIRNSLFFGSGSLTILGTVTINGVPALVVTIAYCKKCGAAMIGHRACEWEVCDACASKCHHMYKRGAVHGSNVDIAVGEFCMRCGSGEPQTKRSRKQSAAERHVEAEQELGIIVVYKNSSLTPEQVLYLEQKVRAMKN